MAENFLLEIVSPVRKLLSKEVEEVVAPGFVGEFGVLAWHTHLITLLKAGVVTYKKGAEAGHIVIGKGYAEVGHKRTTILVDTAELPSDIDLDEAKDTLSKTEEALKKLTAYDAEYEGLAEAAEFQQLRIAVKEKHKA